MLPPALRPHIEVFDSTINCVHTPGGWGGGGTPIYWLYGYVPLERVWFSSHLLKSGMGSSNH